MAYAKHDQAEKPSKAVESTSKDDISELRKELVALIVKKEMATIRKEISNLAALEDLKADQIQKVIDHIKDLEGYITAAKG